jgi:hypothetical protein
MTNAIVETRQEVRELTKNEAHLLKEKEDVIRKGVATFMGVGEALMTIRDRRLYRAEYATFEEYCRKKWQFSKSHANRYITAKSVVDNLQEVDQTVLPKVESQIRPLAFLKPAEQRRVWKKVVEEVQTSHRPLTANIVTRQVSQLYPDVETYRKPTQPKKGNRVRLQKDIVLEMIDEAWEGDRERLEKCSAKEILKWVKALISGF